jgi:hypothetical protein
MTGGTSRRRPGRLAAGAIGAALLVAWPFAPSASAENLTLQIDSPGDGETLRDSGATVSGRVGTGLLTSVDRIKVTVTRQSTGQVIADEVVCAPCGQGAAVPFSYDTPALEYNGPYRVRVVASGFFLATGIRVDDAVAERAFSVAAYPAPPTGLRAERSEDRKVTLSWNAVRGYPDLAPAYAIYRAVGSGELKLLGASSTTSYVDDQTALVGGTFRYQVSAVRHGPSGNSSQAHDWLEARSNEVTVDVPAPPPGSSPAPGDPQGGGAGNIQLPTAGGNSQGGLGGADLTSVLSGASRLPSSGQTSPPTTVDNGFSANLPFPSVPASGQPTGGRSSAAGAPDDREPGPSGLTDSNRRALLVPVAAGSVLCVAALHLRWLSRQLAPPVLDAIEAGVLDLEHDVPLLDPDTAADAAADVPGDRDVGAPDRLPVGAGRGPA